MRSSSGRLSRLADNSEQGQAVLQPTLGRGVVCPHVDELGQFRLVLRMGRVRGPATWAIKQPEQLLLT